ncbi:hypothetical protein GJAV_G00035930 [Gymnothorax javanicus]|nr:hypothetical protein GJAV_G00035930 [Gymnothorax javanicus]
MNVDTDSELGLYRYNVNINPYPRLGSPFKLDFLQTHGHGTGHRHKVREWPKGVSGRQHKLVIPAEHQRKLFVLLVGDSHLQSIADGIVKMPDGGQRGISFGVSSTPGACARQLRTELLATVLPRTPDAICVTSPTNCLTASRTVEEAGVDFALLLRSALDRCPMVYVTDFPPRLTIPVVQQELFRQEFLRVAVRMGVKFFNFATECFPLDRLELWSRWSPFERQLWDGHPCAVPVDGCLSDPGGCSSSTTPCTGPSQDTTSDHHSTNSCEEGGLRSPTAYPRWRRL